MKLLSTEPAVIDFIAGYNGFIEYISMLGNVSRSKMKKKCIWKRGVKFSMTINFKKLNHIIIII